MESSVIQQRKALRHSINKYVAADAHDATAHLRKDMIRNNRGGCFSTRQQQR